MNTTSDHINTEVAVVGIGAAGLAAASSLADLGLKVTIVEKNNYPGGMATAAYVGTICGLYKRSMKSEESMDVTGFARDFASRLMHLENTGPMTTDQGLRFLPYERDTFIKTSLEFLNKRLIESYFQTTLIDVKYGSDRITSLSIQTPDRQLTINPSIVIDTTGWASIGKLCCPQDILRGERYQAGAYVFGLDGLHASEEFNLKLHLIKALRQCEIPELKVGDRSVISVVPGSFKNGRAYFKLSIPYALQQTNEGLEQAKRDSQKVLQLGLDYLKGKSDAFRSAKVCMWASEVGVRTGPRYRGRDMLRKEDVLNCTKWTNSAARGYWPIEYWSPGKSVQMTYFAEDDYFDIPIGCLQSATFQNLLFAGRHISSEESAIASARVIGTCLQMGESAARVAASMMSTKNGTT